MERATVRANQSWKIGLLLTSLLSPTMSGQEMPPLKVSIITYDAAHVGFKARDRAEQLAATILLTAAIQSRWEAADAQDLRNLPIDFTAHTGKNCQADAADALVRVQILPDAPIGVPADALGFSLPCARSGVKVTIYADHVSNVSNHGGPTFGRVLGYAIAHELGHVLLYSNVHEREGLMKAIWSKSDWQRAAVEIIPFSQSDARQIALLHERLAGRNLAQLTLLNAR